MSTPVEQIKERLSILDVVGGYVKLTKSGKHHKGKSPFTNEKTPSFFVSPERGMYYCFSTSKGGDVFSFVQEMEGVDFRGALKILAERAGVELVAEDPKARSERDTLYKILEEATLYFGLELAKNPLALEYLQSRGVKEDTKRLWRIGFAPAEWRSLRTYLKAKGYSDAQLLSAGLAKEAGSGKEPYDVFRNRLMFPIADASGRVVAFSGRDMSGEPTAPKYVNSPETQLFEKSRILFGYDKAKNGIRTFDFSLVVEGQFDLVLSHQAGYTNAVAISGTALTEHHLELLSRLSTRIVFALDADTAGIASAKRAAALALARGMDVKVAHIEGGKDPADLVREDPQLLKACVGKATHIIEFLLSLLKTEKDERKFRLRVRDEVLPFVARIENRLDSEHFEGVVAEALGSARDTVHFEVERIRAEFKSEEAKDRAKSVTKAYTVTASQGTPAHPASGLTFKRTEDIIGYLYATLLTVRNAEYKRLDASNMEGYLQTILGEENMKQLTDWSADETSKALFTVESEGEEEKDFAYQERIAALLLELKLRLLRDTLRTHRLELKRVEGEGNATKQTELTKLCADVQKELSAFEGKNPFTLA